MAFTKINAAGIGTTETVTVDGLTVINDGSFGGNLTVSGVLTYEDVTNVDSVGLITARNGIVVGSGITLSKDGDIFATGITTVSGNVKVGTGITLSPDGDGFYTGVVTATTFKGDGSQLTGVNSDVVDDTTPQLGGNLDVNTKNILFGDSSDGSSDDALIFGAGSDLAIYHDGSNSFIKNSTGNLRIQDTNGNIQIQAKAGEESIIAKTDGAVELYYDNSKKFETTSYGSLVTGRLNTTGNIAMPDNAQIHLGDSSDLAIYHDGSAARLHSASHPFYIRSGGQFGVFKGDGTESMIVAEQDAEVKLYHNNVKKFETHDVGTIFTEAGSGSTQAAIKVNTTLDEFGSVTVRDRTDVNNAVAGFQVENASNGTDETNLLLRSVNLGTTAFAHGIYAAKSHRFGVSSNTTPTVQVDSDGLKFNNDQAAANALDDYEEGSFDATCANSVTLHSAVNRCSYTKIGRVVTVRGQVRINNDNGTSDFVINNLPFTNADADGEDSSLSVGAVRLWDFNVTSDTVNVICLVVGQNTNLEFWVNKDNASSERLDADSNAYIAFTVTYFST